MATRIGVVGKVEDYRYSKASWQVDAKPTTQTREKVGVKLADFVRKFRELNKQDQPEGQNKFHELTRNGVAFSLAPLRDLRTGGRMDPSYMNRNVLSNCDGYLLTFSITNRSSFEYLEELRNEIIDKHKKKENSNLSFVLVGNNCELEHERVISKEEAEDLAEKWGVDYIECSSTTGENVKEAVHTIFDLCQSPQ
eukprot:TRINITY_DN3465_c0_g1_i3.p1 TRINITY_DN3465_c0_g1~~TRINITY_DN3465_c0_g1_i3.p1  ORF type:complete len:195 (-),score=52.12 TRINITY_DN3465_c0_g1_i3:30-614(-)